MTFWLSSLFKTKKLLPKKRRLSREERAWLALDEYEFWQFAQRELLANKLRLRRTAHQKDWFSDEEIKAAANRQLTEVGTPQSAPTPRGILRFFQRTDHSSEHFNKPSRRDRLLASLLDIALFTPDKLAAKQKAALIKLDRQFRGKMKALQKSLHDYHGVMKDLSDETVENEISHLRQQYFHLGRQREWFSAFKEMVEQVVRESRHSSFAEGLNEPAARILQQDFVQTMRSQYDIYERLAVLRTYCFEHSMTEEIDQIVRLRSHIADLDHLIRPSAPIEEVARLVKQLEEATLNHQRQNQTPAPATTPQNIDQRERLNQWQLFIERHNRERTSPQETLRQLLPVIEQNSGWHLAYEVFNAQHHSRAVNSQELRAFLNQIVSRIGNEIDVDIRFQFLCQQLTDTPNRYEDAQKILREVNSLQLLHGVDALDAIHDLKQRFLEEQRNLDQNKVTTLFGRK